MTHRSPDGNGVFIVLVLLASAVWTHRVFITKAEYGVLLIWLLGSIVMS
jgi:hypothetical protein